MDCHTACAACCIAPEISSPLPNMPKGKPAGVPCVNLDGQRRCKVYDGRPPVCRNFQPNSDCCGVDHKQAMQLIAKLEILTK
ncbi:MAG: hypothetical protein C9356_03305 [Oleiphilus sp.]|nr:MAG: hypothetical protein C9356_03305 [Oleiphilus sp.]